MKILTYSLRAEADTSDEFYLVANKFTDRVLQHGETSLLPAARKLQQYVVESGIEPVRTTEEYAFDLLTMGILWRIYSDAASQLARWRGRLLRRAVILRSGSRTNRLKPVADRVRAVFGARWLAPVALSARSPGSNQHLTMETFNKLLLWLEASGEYSQEAKRLRVWQHYLKRQPASIKSSTLQVAEEEAIWFKSEAAIELGRYTVDVTHYQAQLKSRSRSREDALLRERRQVEYHLNLLGAELMNRAYCSDYRATTKRVVLLPICLKTRNGMNCAATRSGQPHHCRQCAKECPVSQIVELGREENFDVIMVSHESDAYSQKLTEHFALENIGIVGVACALNLIAGGLRAKSRGISAQCVILDYCGCHSHWDDDGGFPTDLNMSRLRQIIRQ